MTDPLEEKLQSLIDDIEKAIVKVRQNKITNISYLEKDVATLCKQIVSAPDNKGRSIEPKMVEMINKLNELESELKDFKERAGNKNGHH